MPSANKMTTPVSVDLPVLKGRYAELDGYTVGFESYPEDVDPAPLFAGLPEDRCQCTHWGVVQSGQVTFRWTDHEETYGAGDAYHAPPGHLPLISGGTSLVEFSPTDGLEATMAVIEANLATAGDLS
ncbi:cupin domain-containing protein [Nocardioides sp. HM23]|uniref:cupin domain-containing protein n=1 Tax=Nocardioides bizhenqiangii TaxID=3095076 RepID=UPI002ACAB8A1|nr:cupin domain-containing protein [Nocardioides sp. HM23]MDZ5622421.1 cupin domain-containing protein [Nocardioides sp. HM23]